MHALGQFGHLQCAHKAASVNISLSICLPNCVKIGPSATELWRHIHFSRWRSRHRNSISGFGFRAFAYLERSKYTCIPNFGAIPQSTAEILLLPVSKKTKRPTFWNSTWSLNIYACVSIGMSFCICLPNFVQIGPSATELWCHIHFQNGSQGIAILLPVSVFVISLIREGRNLPACQISTRYLNPRLRYYYFQFVKTNIRHFVILLPVSIFTPALPWACHFVSVYQFLPNRTIRDRVMM